MENNKENILLTDPLLYNHKLLYIINFILRKRLSI